MIPFLQRHPIIRLMVSPQHLKRTMTLGVKSIWLHKLRSFLTALGLVIRGSSGFHVSFSDHPSERQRVKSRRS